MMKPVPLVVALGIALVSSGCGKILKTKQVAEAGVADFHKAYNDGNWSAIYTNSHATFQKNTSEKQFNDLLGAMQRKLGKATQSANIGFNIRSFNLTTTTVLNQKSTFEQGSGDEVFTFEMTDGKPVLVGYHINSNDLILK
jgi:hypothetical protein